MQLFVGQRVYFDFVKRVGINENKGHKKLLIRKIPFGNNRPLGLVFGHHYHFDRKAQGKPLLGVVLIQVQVDAQSGRPASPQRCRNPKNAHPYAVACNSELQDRLVTGEVLEGITTTNVGFYGPQGRSLRLGLYDVSMNEKLASFRYKNQPITNLEMETAAMYAMARLLGHKALSMNVILANRATGAFSEYPKEGMQRLIQFVLNRLTL